MALLTQITPNKFNNYNFYKKTQIKLSNYNKCKHKLKKKNLIMN